MKKAVSILITILVIAIILVASIMSMQTPQTQEEPLKPAAVIATVQQEQIIKSPPVDINNMKLVDNPDVYQYDDPSSVVVLYLTIRRGNDEDNSNHSWQEVNDATKFFFANLEHVVVPKAEVIAQFGNEVGPLPGQIGYGEKVPNGTIQVRGNSSSMRAQKSFKIVLRGRTGGWQGQYTLALNKHPGDPTRIKNKLNYDLLKQVPDMLSLRTQFFHLYVKDETISPPDAGFVDYGLFTQVEQPNTTYLRNHLLDPNAQFYKATFFEFYRYPDEIKLVTDSGYSLEAFERRLEVKGNQNHTKLIKMLDDVNNDAIPIERTFETYFNADNYFTWMAYNMLVGSTDVASQNFYLYSPQNSQKWYFLSWDFDDSLARFTKLNFDGDPYQYWEEGIANYWVAPLHRRVLSVQAYRDQLDAKVEQVYKLLKETNLQEMLDTYRKTTEQILNTMPDLHYIDFDERTYAYDRIDDEIQNNYELYKATLNKPMPFFLRTPEWEDGKLRFTWGESYDFAAQDITYRVKVSKNPTFDTLVIDQTTTNIPQLISDTILEPGEYFWQVVATNAAGYEQYPFDRYLSIDRNPFNGVANFYVTNSGAILKGGE